MENTTDGKIKVLADEITITNKDLASFKENTASAYLHLDKINERFTKMMLELDQKSKDSEEHSIKINKYWENWFAEMDAKLNK
jgi:hypothetical protein